MKVKAFCDALPAYELATEEFNKDYYWDPSKRVSEEKEENIRLRYKYLRFLLYVISVREAKVTRDEYNNKYCVRPNSVIRKTDIFSPDQ